MESNKKKQQFTIQIRRNNIQQKIKSLRSLLITENTATVQNQNQLLHSLSNGQTNIMDKLNELKILSWHVQTANQLVNMGTISKVFQILVDEEITDYQYNELLSVLINVCAHVIIQVPNQLMQRVAASIINLKRQASSLWFIANIIYQKSEFSAAVAVELIQSCSVLNFMNKRLQDKFQSESDIIVFNFFCCSFLSVSHKLSQNDFLKLMKVIETIQKFENLADQNFWYFSEALVDHGQHIKANDYLIFSDPLFAKFHDICKKKKTKLIKNYLKLLITFAIHDKQAYVKMLKYQIFNDLNYCLQNRLPQVKKMCSQIGINLLTNNKQAIDIDNIHFFSQLSLEFINFEKHDIVAQVKLLTYSLLFFQIFIDNLMKSQQKQKFAQNLTSGKAIESLCTLVSASNQNVQILSVSLKLLQLFLSIDQKQQIKKHCEFNGLPQYLSNLYIQNQALYKIVSKFLDHFHQQEMV